MTTTRLWVLAAVALAATATIAPATQPTRFRIDVGVGALAAGNDVSFTDDGERRTADTSGGPAFRVGAGYLLTDHFDLNASAQAASTSAHVFGRNVGYSSVTGGTRYYPLGRDLRVRPWLVGEAGWYRARSRFELGLLGAHTERTEDGGGVNLGTGFDVPLGRLVSLGFDARWNQTVGPFNDPGFLTTTANLGFHFGS